MARLAALLAVLIVWVAWPAGAPAVPADRVELDRAITAAQTFWRDKRHDPHFYDCKRKLRRARITYGSTDGYNAETWNGGSCSAYVHVERGYTRGQPDRARFCRTITHEYGHMLGHHHTSNPSDIMYSQNTAASVPGVCHYPDPHG